MTRIFSILCFWTRWRGIRNPFPGILFVVVSMLFQLSCCVVAHRPNLSYIAHLRVTHRVEEQARSINIQEWVARARSNKWDLAAKVSQHNEERWTYRVLHWDPTKHFDGVRVRTHRRPGKPETRWNDDLDEYAELHLDTMCWLDCAKNLSLWERHREGFCSDSWRHPREYYKKIKSMPNRLK